MIRGFELGFVVLLAGLSWGADGAQEDRSVMDEMLRKPAVAGQFYAGNPETLRKEITAYLDAAKAPAVAGGVVAIVSPHAGYQYSGQVASYGYSLVRGKSYEAVIVISPSHVEYFPYSSVFPGAAYRTPLGDIPIDTALAKLIASKSALVKLDMKGHERAASGRSEHALEVQLPFLQVTLGSFMLVPIVMGDQNEQCVEALGNVLGDALKGRNVLIVASTDLSHFHSDSEARNLDGVFQERLRDFDPDMLFRALSSELAEACGGGPTVVAMIAAKKLGATKCVVLNYANSGDVTGDTDNVVGYVSAVMARGAQAGSANPLASASLPKARGASPAAPVSPKRHKPRSSSDLTNEDKKFLLTLARSVIDAACTGKKLTIAPPLSPIMKEPRGAFVTLSKSGRLRGCIGYIEAIKPLAATIEEMAKAAAFDDRRFAPVRAEEVPQLEIEISVLSPITEVTDPSKIIVGKHGLIITRGMSRGLLLPQVATEWKWDRETFLAQTCVKAGLPEDAWKQKGTKIESFSAEIFSEKELGLR